MTTKEAVKKAIKRIAGTKVEWLSREQLEKILGKLGEIESIINE